MKTPYEMKLERERSELKRTVGELQKSLSSMRKELELAKSRVDYFMNRNGEIWTAVFYEKTLEDAQRRLKSLSMN